MAKKPTTTRSKRTSKSHPVENTTEETRRDPKRDKDAEAGAPSSTIMSNRSATTAPARPARWRRKRSITPPRTTERTGNNSPRRRPSSETGVLHASRRDDFATGRAHRWISVVH